MTQPNAPDGLQGSSTIRIGDEDFEVTPDRFHVAKPESPRVGTFPPIAGLPNGTRVQILNRGTSNLTFSFTNDALNDIPPPTNSGVVGPGSNVTFVVAAGDGSLPPTWFQLL